MKEEDVTLQALSHREAEVLTLAQQGLTDKQIAGQMQLSVETVRTYWQRIRRKVGGVTRSEIVSLWLHQQQRDEQEAHRLETEHLKADLAKREALFQKIRKSEHLFRTICDSAANGLVVLDPKGQVVYRNKRMGEISGYGTEETGGYGWLDFIREPVKSDILKRLIDWGGSTPTFQTDLPIVHANGEPRVLGVSVSPMFEDGSLLGYVATLIDITADLAAVRERESMISHLRQRSAQLQRIAELSPDLIYIVDLEKMQNVYSNRTIGEVLGFSPEEVAAWTSERFMEMFHPDETDALMAHRQEILRAPFGHTVSIKFRAKCRDGSYLWLLTRESPYEKDDSGLTRLALGFTQVLNYPMATDESVDRSGVEVGLSVGPDRSPWVSP